jgi:methylated-DNA-[protein]-cysteine S-methyltransferase
VGKPAGMERDADGAAVAGVMARMVVDGADPLRSADPMTRDPRPVRSIETPVGTLAVGCRDGEPVVEWLTGGAPPPPFDADDPAQLRLADAIERAFAGDQSALDSIPTGRGTDFERRVWEACRTIPRGETRSYGWIAATIGAHRAAARAVGQALRRNPLPVVVPCHRVVAASGLGGYAGDRTGALAEIKRRLLRIESGSSQEPGQPDRPHGTATAF